LRELTPADAGGVTAVARSIGYVWGDDLPVPASEADAVGLLTHWESTRTAGRGNLVGLFAPDDRLLLVVGVVRDQFTAELSAWGSVDASDRKLDVEGVALLVDHLRSTARLVRVWIDLPAHDRYTDYLAHSAGLRHEGTVTRPDGTTRERYASM
jgi:hypothetical protein